MPAVTIIQGERQIIETGLRIVTRHSAPVLLTYEGAELAVAFDLDEPYQRPTGVMVKPTFDDNAVAPGDTVSAPKSRPLGRATAEYFLTPTAEPKGPDPYGLGLTVQPSYQFHYAVTLPAVGRSTKPPAPFEWHAPVPQIQAPVFKNPDAMSFEERDAWMRGQSNGFFDPPKPRPNRPWHAVG